MITKKGMGIADMHPLVLMLVLVGIILGVGALILDKFQAQIPSNVSIAYNATGEALNAIGDFSTWLSIIVIVAAAAIILGLVMMAFSGKRE